MRIFTQRKGESNKSPLLEISPIAKILEHLTFEMTPKNCRAGMVENVGFQVFSLAARPAMAGRALPIPALQKRDTTCDSGNALSLNSETRNNPQNSPSKTVSCHPFLELSRLYFVSSDEI
jgi:hypothetical protein